MERIVEHPLSSGSRTQEHKKLLKWYLHFLLAPLFRWHHHVTQLQLLKLLSTWIDFFFCIILAESTYRTTVVHFQKTYIFLNNSSQLLGLCILISENKERFAVKANQIGNIPSIVTIYLLSWETNDCLSK